MVGAALVGFWPQYYGPLLRGDALEGVSAHPLVHLHSSLFLLWLCVIFGQALLVRLGHVRFHRRIGGWLAGLGYCAAAVGLFSGLALAAARVERGDSIESAATFVAAPLLDMVMFVTFLTGAVLYRRRPEIHKRLVLFTGYSFAFIGLIRYLARVPGVMEQLWLATILLMLPIAMCMAWERLRTGRIHAVWWYGSAIFFSRLMLELLTTLPWWQPIGRALIAPFL
ncbi:hypothetical protein GRI75_09755 [Altererythrobacter soli]|uniref:DUF2306 domain-containing protein n=1 Tax=Croceibacterium soli TaxID=1739690 RepID=A0A6I4UWJ8_9SPHN|nr:hypothetical protein [Croceibacterium soli]MXP41923.1 hypothetical protein [Croceibacterium soli]